MSSVSSSWIPAKEEGQLAIDVFRQDEMLVIRAPIAGVNPDHIAIHLHNGLLTIRGERAQSHTIHEADWFHRECYWGSFSRSILLPEDVDEHAIDAHVKQGILEIHLPIRPSNRRIVVRSFDE